MHIHMRDIIFKGAAEETSTTTTTKVCL